MPVPVSVTEVPEAPESPEAMKTEQWKSYTEAARRGKAVWSYSLNSKSELGLSQTLFKLIQSFPQLSLYLSEDGYCTFRAWKDGKPINPPVWEAFIRGYPPVALTPELESIFIGWQKLFDEQE